MVRDPLEVAVHEDVPRARFDLQASLRHSLDQVVEVFVVHAVDVIVHLHDVPDGFRVVLDEGVNRRVDHLDRSVCHLPDSRKLGFGTARRRTELQREFPDVFRVPSDPVQVGRDLERGRDRPKIPSDGRMEGDEVDARVLDLELETVDFLIDREDLSRNFSVEPGQRVDGLSDRELAELGEGHHVLVQFLQPLL